MWYLICDNTRFTEIVIPELWWCLVYWHIIDHNQTVYGVVLMNTWFAANDTLFTPMNTWLAWHDTWLAPTHTWFAFIYTWFAPIGTGFALSCTSFVAGQQFATVHTRLAPNDTWVATNDTWFAPTHAWFALIYTWFNGSWIMWWQLGYLCNYHQLLILSVSY